MTFEVKKIAIVCPNCREKLNKKEEILFCQRCNKNYLFKDNIPVLTPSDQKIIFENKSLINNTKDFMKKNIPNCIFYHLSLTYSHQTKKNIIKFRSLVGEKASLLIVGGGQIRCGNKISCLGQELLNNSINLEIGSGKNVDVIGDAHRLPFADDTFDGIISQAVLEHTQDSNKCIEEMYRVLKKNGFIYTELPFLQPVHMHSDFRRFTLSGIEEIHSKFIKIDSGVSAGPTSSFIWHLSVFLATAVSFNSQKIYNFIYLILFPLMIPFKYLDAILGRYKTAKISASGIYYLDRK